MKDKLFFFARAGVGQLPGGARPRRRRCRPRRCAPATSASCSGANTFFSTPQIIRDPLTGQPFPGNIIPANRLSPNGLAMLNAYPAPTPGFQSGTNNALLNSPNPQDQRKDNIRFDYRLNQANQFSYRYGKYNWKAVDAFRGDVPVRAHRLGSSEHDADRELDQHDPQQHRQRGDLHLRARPGVHQRPPERSLQAEPPTASPIRTCSRRTRKSPTSSRRSRSPASA